AQGGGGLVVQVRDEGLGGVTEEAAAEADGEGVLAVRRGEHLVDAGGGEGRAEGAGGEVHEARGVQDRRGGDGAGGVEGDGAAEVFGCGEDLRDGLRRDVEHGEGGAGVRDDGRCAVGRDGDVGRIRAGG